MHKLSCSLQFFIALIFVTWSTKQRVQRMWIQFWKIRRRRRCYHRSRAGQGRRSLHLIFVCQRLQRHRYGWISMSFFICQLELPTSSVPIRHHFFVTTLFSLPVPPEAHVLDQLEPGIREEGGEHHCPYDSDAQDSDSDDFPLGCLPWWHVRCVLRVCRGL